MPRIDASQQRRTIATFICAHTGRLAIALGLMSMLLGPSAASPPDNRSLEAWQAEWRQVLQRHVDAKGRVDFSGLANDRTGLDDVVKFVAAVDPASAPALFPTAEARLAYYIDAYNALAMYGVLDAGVPERFGWFGRIRFFYLRKFVVGGRSISLYNLENEVIRPMGDPRVHFALNCMSVSCPRLPRTTFTADGLDRELDAAAREFVGEDRNVHVDRETRTVTLSAIFDFYTKDFLARAPSLVAYVNHYRAVAVPSDYKVQFTDYDWTINKQRGIAHSASDGELKCKAFQRGEPLPSRPTHPRSGSSSQVPRSNAIHVAPPFAPTRRFRPFQPESRPDCACPRCACVA